MDTTLSALFLIVYASFLLIAATVHTVRRSTSDLLSSRRAAYEELGSDTGLWLFCLVPAVVQSGKDGFLRGAALLVGVFCAALFVRAAVRKRARLYTEITGETMTLSGFLTKRLKPKTPVFRLVFGVAETALSLVAAAGALLFPARFLGALFGWSAPVCVVACGVAVLVAAAFGGSFFTARHGALQGILLTAIFAVGAVFVLLGIPDGKDFSQAFSDALSAATAKDTSVVGCVLYAFSGVCLVGSPVSFFRIAHTRERLSSRTGDLWFYPLCAVGAVGVLTVCLFNNGSLLPENGAHFLLTAFLAAGAVVGSLGAAMAYASCGLRAVLCDVVRPLHRKRTASPVLERALCAVLVAGSVALALFFGNDPTSLYVTGAGLLCAAFGPALVLSLYRMNTSALGVSVSAAAGVAVSLCMRLWLSPSDVFAMIVPGFCASLFVLLCFCVFTRRIRAGVKNEFGRMDYLARAKGDLYNHNDEFDEDSLSR